MNTDHKAEIDRHFARFEAKLPAGVARFVGWLRKPSSRLVRIPLAILLVVEASSASCQSSGSGCCRSESY